MMIKKLSFLTAFFFSPVLFAQDGPAPARDQSSFWQTIIMIGIAIVFFYFILWRPEQKRRKQMEKQRNTMKKGDEVVAMGIVGTIDRVKENTVIIKLVEGAKMEILKAAINEVRSKGGEIESEEDKKENS